MLAGRRFSQAFGKGAVPVISLLDLIPIPPHPQGQALILPWMGVGAES